MKENLLRHQNKCCRSNVNVTRIISDLDEIANKFNTYFINIGQSLSEQIHTARSSDEYLSNRTNTIFMVWYGMVWYGMVSFYLTYN